MSKRLIVILALLAVVAAGAAWLHFELPKHAWMSRTGDDWNIAGQGWSLLLAGWPIALAGAVIGGGALFLVFGWLYVKGLEDDTEHEISVMAMRLEHAENQAKTADQRADERLAGQWESLKNKEAAAQQSLIEYETLKSKAIRYCEDAKKEVEAAEAKTAEAEKKRDNSAAMAERFRKKLNRLSGASEGS